MDQVLMGQFLSAMIRLKKLEAIFSAECEMQVNELVVLQSIAGGCGCDGCGVNLNVPEIQRKLQISKPAVSYLLNTLEKKGYITREIDARDRRKFTLNATGAGKAAAEQCAQKYDSMWNGLLADLGEEDMRLLIGLLGRLSDFCEGFQGEGCAP